MPPAAVSFRIAFATAILVIAGRQSGCMRSSFHHSSTARFSAPRRMTSRSLGSPSRNVSTTRSRAEHAEIARASAAWEHEVARGLRSFIGQTIPLLTAHEGLAVTHVLNLAEDETFAGWYNWRGITNPDMVLLGTLVGGPDNGASAAIAVDAKLSARSSKTQVLTETLALCSNHSSRSPISSIRCSAMGRVSDSSSATAFMSSAASRRRLAPPRNPPAPCSIRKSPPNSRRPAPCRCARMPHARHGRRNAPPHHRPRAAPSTSAGDAPHRTGESRRIARGGRLVARPAGHGRHRNAGARRASIASTMCSRSMTVRMRPPRSSFSASTAASTSRRRSSSATSGPSPMTRFCAPSLRTLPGPIARLRYRIAPAFRVVAGKTDTMAVLGTRRSVVLPA